MHLIAAGPDPKLAVAPDEEAQVRAVVDGLRAEGERPYVIPVGGSSGVGALGYAAGTRELVDQLAATALSPARLYYASGSQGHAGRARARVAAVLAAVSLATASRSAAAKTRNGCARRAWRPKRRRCSGFDLVVARASSPPTRITSARVTASRPPGGLEAIRLLAVGDGVLLDPTYTAKAMAALIADVRSGAIAPDETIVFLHTGGVPALFAHAGRVRADSY